MSIYSRITYNSPNLVKRFSHQSRFKHYGNSIYNRSKKNSTKLKFLDYGTGDGFIFIYLKKYNDMKLSLFAYEPSEGQYNDLKNNDKVSESCLDNHISLMPSSGGFNVGDVMNRIDINQFIHSNSDSLLDKINKGVWMTGFNY